MCARSFCVSDFELERSPEARALAEEALALLLAVLDGRDFGLVVLGGLVPELLTGGQSNVPTHLGTTDIDIHISLVADAEADLGDLEKGLESIGAEPDPKIDGWRWLIPIGGLRVKIEFLCDRDDLPAGEAILLPGCNRLAAANLRGTRFVALDSVEEQVGDEGAGVRYKMRFAGLEGYLMAKSYATRDRGVEKDCYDLAHVLLYNRAGGPAAAGALLHQGQFADDVKNSRTVFLEIAARFASATDFGPQSYAAQAMRANPEAELAQLAQDAVAAVAEFIAELKLQ